MSRLRRASKRQPEGRKKKDGTITRKKPEVAYSTRAVQEELAHRQTVQERLDREGLERQYMAPIPCGGDGKTVLVLSQRYLRSRVVASEDGSVYQPVVSVAIHPGLWGELQTQGVHKCRCLSADPDSCKCQGWCDCHWLTFADGYIGAVPKISRVRS